MRKKRISLLAMLGLILFGASELCAQDWAKAMFDHLSHDFGIVLRGQKVEHRFRFKNLYVEDVRVESITSSCGCTVPQVTKSLLKTNEEGEVVATVNTLQFQGQKEATIRVRFSEPFPAEVQLHCYVYIRSDVVLEPGSLAFGTIVAGTASEPVSLTANYAGRPTWQITRIEAPPYVETELKELSRHLSRVTYQLMARIKAEAPIGYLRDQVVLITNDPDPKFSHLYVTLEGYVAPAISARPSPLLLGLLAPGQTVTRTVVVQGSGPFEISKIELPSESFKAKLPGKKSNLHLVSIEFTAPMSVGKIQGMIRLETDVGGMAAIEIPITAQVVSSGATASDAPSSESADSSLVPVEKMAQP